MKLIVAIYFLSTMFALSGEHRFSHMENGDRIEVTMHSTGCFHDSTSYYEIGKKGGEYTFTEYAIIWSKESPRKILEKRVAGRVNLDRDDVSRLDGLLKFYRGKKEAFSTTQVSLVVQYFEPDGLVKVERLRDGSGGYGLEKRKDVVTFFELAKRFGK